MALRAAAFACLEYNNASGENATTRLQAVIAPAQNKPVLVGAVLKACAGRPGDTFLETTAQVAEKVKIQ